MSQDEPTPAALAEACAAVERALDDKDTRAATAALERLSTLGPGTPALAGLRERVETARQQAMQAALAEAELSLSQGRPRRALEGLRRIEWMARHEPQVARLLAEAQRAVGELDEQLGVRPLIDQARRLAVRGQLDQALATAEEAVRLAPNDARAIRLRDELAEQVEAARAAAAPAAAPPRRSTGPSAAEHVIRSQVQALLAAVRGSLERSDLDAAERDVERAIELAPADADAGPLRDEVRSRRRELEASRRLETLVADARRLFEAGQLPACLALLQELVKLDPGHPAVTELRGRAEAALADACAAVERALDDADTRAATTALERLSTLGPGTPALAGLRERVETARRQAMQEAVADAELSLSQGRPRRAIEGLMRIEWMARHEPQVARLLAEAQRAVGELDEQLRVRPLVDQARKLAVRGQLDQALATVEEAVRLAPNDARAIRLRDELAEQAETARASAAPAAAPPRPSMGPSAAEHVIRSQVQALLAAARGSLERSDLDAAERDVERAIELAPADADAGPLRDEVRSRRRELEAGRRLETLVADARRLFEAGRFQACLALLQELVKLDPGHPVVTELRGRAEAALAETEARRTELRTAFAEGREALTRGDVARAVERLTAVLAQDPTHAEAKRALAEARARLAQRERIDAMLDSARARLERDAIDAAQRDVQAALRLDPDNTDAQALWEQVIARIGELRSKPAVEAAPSPTAPATPAPARPAAPPPSPVAPAPASSPRGPVAAPPTRPVVPPSVPAAPAPAPPTRVTGPAPTAPRPTPVTAGPASAPTAPIRPVAPAAVPKPPPAAPSPPPVTAPAAPVVRPTPEPPAPAAPFSPPASSAARTLPAPPVARPDSVPSGPRADQASAETGEPSLRETLTDAERSIREGRADRALETLRAVLTRVTTGPVHDEALRLAARAERAREERTTRARVRALVDRAMKQSLDGNFDEALRLAEEAVLLAPDDARALRLRDDLADRLRQRDKR